MDIVQIDGGAVIMTAPHPRCPTHGQTSCEAHPRAALLLWVCHGFDGEGCSYTATEADLDWTAAGTADRIEFG